MALHHLPELPRLALTLVTCAWIGLAGCASSSGINPVATTISGADLGLSTGAAAAADPALAADWWRAFGDPQLDALMARALAGQPGLKVAQARLARAEAAVASVHASEGVQINGTGDLTRQRFSATSIYPPPLGGSVRTLASAQVGMAWEFDFFGRNRAALEAAVGASRAAEAEFQAARLVLAANVARQWVRLGQLGEQRVVAVRALAQRQEVLDLIAQRVQAGLDTHVELRQGEGALPEARLQIEQLDEQIMLARHALAALSTQAPGALDGLNVTLSPTALAALPGALPADLLARRADISAARWRIEAAGSDIRSAKAQFFPNINLSAFAGLASIGLDRLIQVGSEQFGAGPAIRLPIFDAGRLRANLRLKTADLDAAVESYNGAVLEAVREAADAIGSLRAVERQQREQALALDKAESAWDLATQRYKAGLSTYLVVLNTEAAVLNQRRQLTELKARALDARITLIRALGGGYSADPALALSATP